MHELVLVFAIIFITVAVAVGLVLCARHFLKLRERLAPEVVNPIPAPREAPTREAGSTYGLAA